MTYEEASAYIQDAAKYKISLGLETVGELLAELGNPQEELQFIHIAGTNGKGSVLSYLSAVLSEADYRTGAYSSPAAAGYRERFQINREWISKEDFAAVMADVAEAAKRVEKDSGKHPTQFELETAAAFLYFRRKCCDYVALETGMGGRLDATNIVRNVPVGVITSVSMDHREFLGDTLEKIAGEKAGIIKPGMDVVYLLQEPEVNRVFEKKSKEKGSHLYPVRLQDIQVRQASYRGQVFDYEPYKGIGLQMAGVVQPANAALALKVLEVLKRKGAVIPEKAVFDGLESVRYPARFEILSENPVVVADGAHNADAAKKLADSVKAYFPGRRIIAVMGVFADKDYRRMAELIGPLSERMLAVTPPVRGRALPAEKLCECLCMYCRYAECAGGLGETVRKAYAYAGTHGVILAFGSLSYMGEFREAVKKYCRERVMCDE